MLTLAFFSFLDVFSATPENAFVTFFTMMMLSTLISIFTSIITNSVVPVTKHAIFTLAVIFAEYLNVNKQNLVYHSNLKNQGHPFLLLFSTYDSVMTVYISFDWNICDQMIIIGKLRNRFPSVYLWMFIEGRIGQQQSPKDTINFIPENT